MSPHLEFLRGLIERGRKGNKPCLDMLRFLVAVTFEQHIPDDLLLAWADAMERHGKQETEMVVRRN